MNYLTIPDIDFYLLQWLSVVEPAKLLQINHSIGALVKHFNLYREMVQLDDTCSVLEQCMAKMFILSKT